MLETVWSGAVNGPTRGLLLCPGSVHPVITEPRPLEQAPRPQVAGGKVRIARVNEAVLALLSATEWRSTTAIAAQYRKPGSSQAAKVLLRLWRAGVLERIAPRKKNFQDKQPSLWRIKA